MVIFIDFDMFVSVICHERSEVNIETIKPKTISIHDWYEDDRFLETNFMDNRG